MASVRRIAHFQVQVLPPEDVVKSGVVGTVLESVSVHRKQADACLNATILRTATGLRYRVFHKLTGRVVYETL
jgi:hypothetical protein